MRLGTRKCVFGKVPLGQVLGFTVLAGELDDEWPTNSLRRTRSQEDSAWSWDSMSDEQISGSRKKAAIEKQMQINADRR